VRFPAPVQIGPEAHPASCTMGTGSFSGVKRPGRGVDHPPPSSAEVKERVELYLYSPSGSSWPVLGWTLPLPLLVEGEWSVSRAGHFTPWEIDHSTLWIGGWVGPPSPSGSFWEEVNLLPFLGIELQFLGCQIHSLATIPNMILQLPLRSPYKILGWMFECLMPGNKRRKEIGLHKEEES
jgi:hypothetical protein